MRTYTTLLAIVCLTLSLVPSDCLTQAEPPPVNPTDTAILQQLEVLDLETAQRIALANSPTLMAAAERANQAGERVKQAEAAYWPTLDADGSVSRVDLSNNAEDAQLRQLQFFNPNASVDNPEDYYQAGLVASWTVFDGFRREFNNALAKYGEEASQAALVESRRLLLSSVADSYYIAQLARNAH